MGTGTKIGSTPIARLCNRVDTRLYKSVHCARALRRPHATNALSTPTPFRGPFFKSARFAIEALSVHPDCGELH
eukprot:4704428-Prymnesium_polylepis.1